MFSHVVNAGMWAVAYMGAVVLDEKSFVSLGTMTFVLSGAWWLGRKLQSLEDGLEEVRRAAVGDRGCQCTHQKASAKEG